MSEDNNYNNNNNNNNDLDDLFGAFDGKELKTTTTKTATKTTTSSSHCGDPPAQKDPAVGIIGATTTTTTTTTISEKRRTDNAITSSAAASAAASGNDTENDNDDQKQEPPTKKVRLSGDDVDDKYGTTKKSESGTTTSSLVLLRKNDGKKNKDEEKQAVSSSLVKSLPTSGGVPTTTTTTPATNTENGNNDVGNSGGGDVHREIATGTAHDKSVRSYSSYPKHTIPSSGPPRRAPGPPPPISYPPAKEYAFQLDPFQEQAIRYIDCNESVLVAAHTSAGKTAVAEYAIAKSLKLGQRVVYTSPIKALSNQKFRDLQEEFGNVGLMTGDMTINPEATVLVMTTEILRSMLYRGSELMRELAWVIYDEVHYMRDTERGVVWEESIILLPHSVHFCFLSATIPNANQFANWITAVHHQPCHVIYTNYRPVPLQHYIFPQGGDGLHLVVDEKGKFRETNFQKAMTTLQSKTGSVDAATADALSNSGNGKRKGGATGGAAEKKKKSPFADLHRIVKLIMDRNLNPVIVFSFSKKDCERYALALNREDYNDDVEKDLISQVYTNAIDSLGEDDRKLPQVEALLPLLKRGIGIHHGGLLPILKEIVEILFSEGLIKVLFATETFSIGINMPAKTVIFTVVRKWDGKDFRWLSCGEYTQMSGRAGRRGLDKKGTAIQMLDEKMEPAVCKDILYGVPDPLNSSYRIKYNMLLNLMRVEDVDPEYLLRKSFHQYQREKDAPGLIVQAEDIEKEAEQVQLLDATPEQIVLVGQYYQMDEQLQVTKRRIRKQFIQKPEYCLKYLQAPGRLLDVRIDDDQYGFGVLVSCKKKPGTGSAGDAGRRAALAPGPQYTLDVLLMCCDRRRRNDNDNDDDQAAAKEEGNKKSSSSANDDGGQAEMTTSDRVWRGSRLTCRPVRNDDDDPKLIFMRVFTIGLEQIQDISAVRIFAPKDVTTPEARRKVAVSVREVKKRLPDGIPILDPIKDMGIIDDALQTLVKRAETLQSRLTSHELKTQVEDEGTRQELLKRYKKRAEMMERAKALRETAKNCQTIAMKDDLKKMKRVLKRLGHVDADGVIQTKGRTACEINTADELVVVELIFAGVFNDLSVEQSVSLLSCMTYDERYKDDEDPTKGMKSYLTKPFMKLQEIARTVAKVEIACGIDIVEDEFVDKFNPGMMEAVYAWCKGVKFIEVQKLTGTFEGTTIRTLRRLEELVRQITVAAKAIGNLELESKFEKGGELIKRDIVFCSSLYL